MFILSNSERHDFLLGLASYMLYVVTLTIMTELFLALQQLFTAVAVFGCVRCTEGCASCTSVSGW